MSLHYDLMSDQVQKPLAILFQWEFLLEIALLVESSVGRCATFCDTKFKLSTAERRTNIASGLLEEARFDHCMPRYGAKTGPVDN